MLRSKEEIRRDLVDRRAVAERKIKVANKRYLNNTPLIAQYRSEIPENHVVLLKFIRAYTLKAITESDVQFPVHLIIGIHEKNGGFITNSANGSSFFLWLDKKKWVEKGRRRNSRIWEVDLTPLLNRFGQNHVINYISTTSEEEGELRIKYTDKHKL